MIQVIYEYPEAWPEDGHLQINATLAGEIHISPDDAVRRANGYLASEAALFVVADDPMLVLTETPVWRMTASLSLRGLGNVAVVGSIDVNAVTGDVIPLSKGQISTLRDRASHVASRITSATTPAG